MNDREIEQLKAKFLEAVKRGRVTICPPLPRRVRLRLWVTHHINGLGIWLVDHGHIEAAIRLWRICGMW